MTICVGFAVPLQAQPRPEVTGSIRGGYWSSTRDLDDRAPLGGAMAWIKGRLPLPSGGYLFAEGWGALSGPPERGRSSAELREAYVVASYGTLDLRLGRQIIAWGRADGVNPTGNLVAEDLTLLTPDDADRRLGAATALLTSFFGGTSISGVWLPEFRGHRLPLAADGGTAFQTDARRWPGDQWAARVERTGSAVDWSASYFRGRDIQPDLEPASPGVVALRHRWLSVIGADAATTAGRYGLRAEAAYTQTGDRDGTDPFTKNPHVFVVIGGDRTYAGRFNLNLQYLARARTRFHEFRGDTSLMVAAVAKQQSVLSNETRRTQHGASMRASMTWLHETLETEWAAIGYAAPRGTAMRPKVRYSVTDQVTLISGAELFRGSPESVFRMLRPNSVFYAEARWGF